jgi:hypothetical protein
MAEYKWGMNNHDWKADAPKVSDKPILPFVNPGPPALDSAKTEQEAQEQALKDLTVFVKHLSKENSWNIKGGSCRWNGGGGNIEIFHKAQALCEKHDIS